MTLPMFPLLLEIHYRCADSPDNQWIVLNAAFAEAELELLQTGIEQGFIACDTKTDVADYYRLSLTERASWHVVSLRDLTSLEADAIALEACGAQHAEAPFVRLAFRDLSLAGFARSAPKAFQQDQDAADQEDDPTC